MHLRRLQKAVFAITFVALAACGSDSTGPGDVSADEALSSLARGFNGSGASLPFGISTSVLGNAGSLSQIDVTIDGAAHTMFALGSRVTYPSGTCFEALFVIQSVTFPPGECTPPPMGLALVLWETRSGSRPPERLVFLSADVGTVDFGFDFGDPLSSPSPVILPLSGGFYITDRQEFWGTVGGSLTSHVTATSKTCSVTPPPFAKRSTCHVASFDESGSITFEKFDFTLLHTPGVAAVPVQTMQLVIPRQTILGIVQAITEIQPITFPTQ